MGKRHFKGSKRGEDKRIRREKEEQWKQTRGDTRVDQNKIITEKFIQKIVAANDV